MQDTDSSPTAQYTDIDEQTETDAIAALCDSPCDIIVERKRGDAGVDA